MARASDRILEVGLYEHPSAGALFTEELGRRGFEYEYNSLRTESTFKILSKSFFVRARLSDYDLIITKEYFASFGVNLRLLLTRARTKHVTIGLNQSRRLLKSSLGPINRLIDAIFNRTNLMIVHSRREATLFNQIHNIPADKFHFLFWGFDLPQTTPTRFSAWPKRYVCFIGRNNRDVETFIRAVTGLDVDAVIIVPASQRIDREDLSSNIHLFLDLPFNETLDCIKNAAANVILLKSDDRGAGHITVVAAMFAGTPQIISDVEVIKDYVVDGVSALMVPLGDAGAVRTAIERILNDPSYAARLSLNAKDYAQRWLTNEQVTKRTVSVLEKLVRGLRVPSVDPEWLSAYSQFMTSD
jgi:glycosyltransferase involved in cell wall biosynthesis